MGAISCQKQHAPMTDLFNLKEIAMKNACNSKFDRKFAKNKSSSLQLKQHISAEEIRDNLGRGNGGVGFLFHATHWDTLAHSFHNIGKRTPELEEELWNCKPIYSFSKQCFLDKVTKGKM